MPGTGQDAAPTFAEMDARLSRLESRMTGFEQKLYESQSLVTRKLQEIFGLIKKQQRVRDARVDEALRKVLEQLTELKNRLVVDPTITH
jgi:transposase